MITSYNDTKYVETAFISDYNVWINIEKKINQLCPLILPFAAKLVKIESSADLTTKFSTVSKKSVCFLNKKIYIYF